MHSPIYLALDFPDWRTSDDFLKKNNLSGVPVKVGMELFYKEGPSVIEKLKQNNHSIFLDLKLHDIPNTVNKAMRNIGLLGVDIVNIHASGGEKMVMSAKEGLIKGAGTAKVPLLLGVTVLTSFDEPSYYKAVRSKLTVEETVLHQAEVMQNNGGDGIVCSSWEAGMVKKHLGNEFMTMCPGIRLKKTDTQDQQRVTTPQTAKENGAKAIVIGRSVTEADNPNLAWRQAEEEWYRVIKA